MAYFEKQQFAEAIATFEDALKYANQDMWTNLGMVLGRSPVLGRGELLKLAGDEDLPPY